MTVAEIQRALIRHGFKPGRVDGLMGGNTMAAIRAFQASRGLAQTGMPNPATRSALAQPARAPVTAVAEVAATPVAEPQRRLFLINQQRATRPISEIIIHCTATPEGREVSVETIRGWHKGQGWKDIGYHWVVGLDGVPRPGRPEAQVGSHVKGRNTGTLGVVYVGGVARDGRTPKDTRTPAQREGLKVIVSALLDRYPGINRISGHNEFAAKACPSFDVPGDEIGNMPGFRAGRRV